MTADRHKQNSNKILTVIHCDRRVPDTRGEVEHGEGEVLLRKGVVTPVGQMVMMW